MPERPKPRLRIRIKPAAENAVRGGHPWVFEESIREVNRQGEAGEIVAIYDRNDTLLALGLYDPDSPIRIRILHAGKPVRIDQQWWEARFDHAIGLRSGLFDSNTNGYRVINGESDGWPGLVLDRYDGTYVVKLYTIAWAPRLDLIASIILKRLQPERIVLRLSRNIEQSMGKRIGKRDGETIYGTPPQSAVMFKENGLRFEADVVRGQKTGFFLDQRENRKRVAEYALGKSVLNTFSFSGGFSVYCAAAGAASVANLDISRHALDSAGRNFELSREAIAAHGTSYEEIQADAIEWLGGNENRQFDIIVLDPPSFAKREAERSRAIQAYASLASSAIGHLKRNGILAACSCSAHTGADEFWKSVRGAAVNSQRGFEEVGRTRHAPDHPATFKEAEYLKAIYLRF
jgi:23S rRNA (cytosine1962-C5)-methyltransferase